MPYYLTCLNCGWSGSDSKLAAHPDDYDFSYCPNCGGDEFDAEWEE